MELVVWLAVELGSWLVGFVSRIVIIFLPVRINCGKIIEIREAGPCEGSGARSTFCGRAGNKWTSEVLLKRKHKR